jgi:hypothetical protein
MTIQEAIKHLAEQKEQSGRLANASVAILRQATLSDGIIRFTVGHLLPLPGEAEVVDEQAREECRRFLHNLGDTGHILSVEARYTKDTPGKPLKRLGMPYTFSGKLKCYDALKGEDKTPEEMGEEVARHRRNGTIAFWCCDTTRRVGPPEGWWRTPKLGAISALTIAKTRIPVEFVKPNGEKVELNWQDLPVRQTV